MQGLLLAKGPGIMKGYYNDEANTAKAFSAGNGWFDTGDLGWRAPSEHLCCGFPKLRIVSLASATWLSSVTGPLSGCVCLRHIALPFTVLLQSVVQRSFLSPDPPL